MQRQFLGIFVILLSLLLSACDNSFPKREQIDSFAFIDHNGENFGTADLAGHVWIADFIFTNCETVCSPMTIEMANLQESFKEKGLPVHFVSFTVDPMIDTPEQLNKYKNSFSIDDTNWHFLTGYTQQEIEVFAREQFKTIVQKPDTSTQVIHGTNFYLINQNGELIGDYNYIDSTYDERLLQDIQKLIK